MNAPLQPRTPTSVFLRVLVASLSGCLFSIFLVGSVDTWSEIARQDWNASDSTWLKWQFWAQQFPWKWGLAAAVAGFCFALVGARLALIAWDFNVFGYWRGIGL
ncbi:MAG: hypothetical protein MK213_00815, partial [Planctomycetes bacterium]|nr:hypothetical protein [Planctomycetota bacterium]